MHYKELRTRDWQDRENVFERHLLVKQFPYTSRRPVSMSEKSDEHGQEEYYVSHENVDSIDEAAVSM